MNVLVTGASGFLGSHICASLLQLGFQVKALVRDTRQLKLLKSLENKLEVVEGDILDIVSIQNAMTEVEVVVHSAGLVSFRRSDERSLMKINVEGTANMINVSVKSGIKHFIHISSVSAFSRSKNALLISENQKWITSSLNSRYAFSKYLSELEVWRGQAEGLNVTILNPSVILGPGDLQQSSPKIFGYVKNKQRFYTKSSLNYVDIRDVADIVIRTIQDKPFGEKFIVSAGNISHIELFKMIASKFTVRSPHIYLNYTFVKIFTYLEFFKYIITGIKPIIERDAIKSLKWNFNYNNQKVKSFFNFKFRNLQDSVDWTCNQILNNEFKP